MIFGQRNALKEWQSTERGVASALVEVECLRTLDRVRLAEGFGDADVAARRESAYRLIEAVEIVELTGPVLSRASQPLPTALGTLDALHLATALLWRGQTAADLVMATHDKALTYGCQGQRSACDRGVKKRLHEVTMHHACRRFFAGKRNGVGRFCWSDSSSRATLRGCLWLVPVRHCLKTRTCIGAVSFV